MYSKLIIATISILFLCVQLGHTLNCYSCDSPQACKAPKKITCNTQNANDTRAHLAQYFQNVSNSAVMSDKFSCFRHELRGTVSNVTYKGCAFRDLHACSLKLSNTSSNMNQTQCVDCPGDLCNPAGTYSTSVFTMFASMMGVVIVLKSFLQ